MANFSPVQLRRKTWSRIARTAWVGCTALISFTSIASASVLDDLSGIGNYDIIALGSGKTIAINSGPITGNVLLGHGVNAAFSGGGNGQITGTLFFEVVSLVLIHSTNCKPLPHLCW